MPNWESLFRLIYFVIHGRIKEVMEVMGMLKSISLENYKCFKNKTDIDIAPLTVLCGVNSSGKSSILKSLLMLKQSYEDNNASNNLIFNGKYVDNGSFNEILSYNSSNKYFHISNSFDIAGKGISKDSTNFKDLYRLYYNKKIKLFKIINSIDVIESTGFVNANKIAKYDISIIIIQNNGTSISSHISMVSTGQNTYNISCKQIPDTSGNLDDFEIRTCTCHFSGMVLNSIYKEKMNDQQKLFIPAIVSIFNIIYSQYMQIRYIAPLRESPKRRYITDKSVSSVGVFGENAAILLKNKFCKKWDGITAPVSENNVNNLLYGFNSYKFHDIFKSWLRYFELGNIWLDKSQQEIIKIKINNSNVIDVGFGVSQVLPILVEGIYMPPEQTLLLEQPEIHLHPKMQMKIADFLLSLAMQNKQIIVETHSDHFINRLVRRCMEDRKFHEKVQIFFIDKDENNVSHKQPITIDDVNGALCENENFFYQFANETAKIIDIGYRNLQNKKAVEGENNV